MLPSKTIYLHLHKADKIGVRYKIPVGIFGYEENHTVPCPFVLIVLSTEGRRTVVLYLINLIRNSWHVIIGRDREALNNY